VLYRVSYRVPQWKTVVYNVRFGKFSVWILPYFEMLYWIMLQRFIDVSEEPTAFIFRVDVFYNLLHIPRRKQYSDNLFRLALYWLMLVAMFLLIFSLIGPINTVFGHVPAFLQKHSSVPFGHRKICLSFSSQFCSFTFQHFALRAAPLFDPQCGRIGSSGEQFRQHEKSLHMLVQEHKGKRPLRMGDYVFYGGWETDL